MAHIRAGSWGDLGFGQGYACAQDHAPLIIDQIVKVRSERARYFGAGPDRAHVDSDFGYLALDVTSTAEVALANQPIRCRELVEGYAAGINAWMVSAESPPLPEWCAPAAAALPVSTADLFAYFADLTMAAGARNLIPYIASARPPDESGPAPAPPLSTRVAGYASNAWAIGGASSATGNGIVMSNPHFPWYGEVRFWECHLTLPGELDVYGVVLVGTPGVQLGFNQDVGWAHTFSVGSRFTLYRYDLDPGDPTRYRYGEERRPMSSRALSVDVLGDDGETRTEARRLWDSHHGPMLNLPLLGWTNDWAFSFRDANRDNDRFLAQFLAMDGASSLEEFREVFRAENGIPWVNTLATSREGKAWYIDASRTPNLSDDAEARYRSALETDPITRLLYDNRVVLLDGSDPESEWIDEPGAPALGLVPFDKLPQLERDDWVANANESHWLTNPNEALTGFSILFGREGAGPSPRTRASFHALATAGSGSGGRLTVADVASRVVCNAAVLAPHLCPGIAARCRLAGTVTVGGADIDLERAAEVLEDWDHTFDLHSRGAALWRETMASLPGKALSSPGPLLDGPIDFLATVATLSLAPKPEEGADPIALAVARAVTALDSARVPIDAPLGEVQWVDRAGRRVPVHGGQEVDGVANVLEPEGMFPISSLEPLPAREAPVPGRTELTGLRHGGYGVTYGTSFTMVVEMTPEGPKGRGFLAYGQSSDPTSPHFADQVDLYVRKEMRPLRFTMEEIEADPALSVRTILA